MKLNVALAIFLWSIICHNFLFAQTEFVLREDAKRISKSCFTVTLDQLERKGAIWWPNKVDLSKDLELNFVVYLGNKDGGGADGIGFIFHNDPRGFNAKGSPAGGLYFGDHPDRGDNSKIVPSVAIEFDTYSNPQCSPSDPTYDHTAIVYNGDMCNPKLPSTRLHKTKDNVEDNTCYKSIIRWNASSKTLQLFFMEKGSATPELIFTYTDDLVNTVFGGNTSVYYGFTGSTGGAGNDQTICIFEGNSSPTAKKDNVGTPFGLPIDVDVQANDFDADGDPLFTTAIITPPKHGTASILSYKNKVHYSPTAGYSGLDSLEYKVCDLDPGVGGEKCYSNCSNAWVIINQIECPTYTLMTSKVKDNEKCDASKPDNGAARAFMWDGTKEITTDFTFKWYKGNFATPAQVTALTPDYTGINLGNLAEGTYTVWSELNLTSCKAPNVATVTINKDVTKIPEFTVALNKSVTNCTPANGEAEVNFNNPADNPANYEIIWYEVFPTKVFTGKIFNKAEAKTYTVQVKNLASGCSSIGTINVPKSYISPVITKVSTSRKSCSSLDGSLSANVAGNTTNYEFRWSVANDKKMFNPFSGPVYSGLDTGNYWLNVRDKITGCYYDTISVRVDDGRVMPVINSFIKNSQTSCDDSKPNGTIDLTSIDAGAPFGNYEYEWFAGNNTTVPLPSVKHSAHKAYDLSAGFYTIKVKKKNTDCFTTKLFDIIEEKDAPQVKITTQLNPTKCSPSDGQIAVAVDPDGAGPKAATTTNYTFNWWKGGSVKITTPDYTGASITGLPAGQYTVQATSNKGCQANISVTLNPAPASAYPSITLTPADDNSCDASKPNGKIVAVVTGGSSSYSYKWYRGMSTSGVDLLSAFNNKSTITGLAQGSYTLLITDNNTGCTAQKDVDINHIIAPAFAVSASGTDITCINTSGISDGKATANVAGNQTAYTFNWFKGNYATAIPDYIGAEYANLVAGIYTVVAVDTFTHCESSPSTVTINHTPSPFGIQIIAATTDCLTPSGKLQANTPPGTYIFDWFIGLPDLPVYPYFSSGRNSLGSNDLITGLYPNLYYVRIVDAAGCVALASIDLTKSSSIPAVFTSKVDNTNCAGATPNGVVNIDYIIPDPVNAPGVKVFPVAGAFPGYKIYWINGAIAPASLPAQTTSANYTGLAGGAVYSVIVDIGTPCMSALTSEMIDNIYGFPQITITNKVHKSYCMPPNGGLRVNIINYTGIPADYSASVKRNGVTYTPSPALPSIANPWILTGLDNGTYSITLTNVKTQCATSVNTTISDIHINPTNKGGVQINDNYKCDGTGNGSLELISGGTSPHPNVALYKYNWYKVSDNTAVDVTGIKTKIDNLPAGKYSLIIIDRVTGCEAAKREFSIWDLQSSPTVNVISTQPQTNCLVLDGSAKFKVGTNPNYTHYALSWAKTYPTAAPAPSISNGGTPDEFIASGLDSGNYILTVSDVALGCTISTPFKIDIQRSMPVLSVSSTDVSGCVPNGSITATITQRVAPYTTTLQRIGSLAPDIVTTNPGSFGSLLPGEYLATVVDNKGCPSPATQITLLDKVVKPKLQIVDLSHNSSCTATPNGLIKVTSAPKNNYTYTWTSLTAGGSFLQTAGNDSTITQVKGGTYRIRVKDPAMGSICMDSMDIAIRDTTILFTPLVSKFDVTHCSYPYDGALIASVTGGTSGYNFVWTNLDSANKQYVGPEFSNLPPGSYTLDVTHIVSSCSVHMPIELLFIPVPISAVVVEDAPQSNCDPLKPNAQWYASVNGEISGYTFDWYEGNSVASGKFYYSGTTPTKMKAVEYTLRIKDLLRGCIKDTTIVPSNMPDIVSAPDIDSLKHLTSCNAPNGYALVSVNGNTSDYIFNWYKGGQGSAPVGNPSNQPKGPDYIGYEQKDLDIGTYTVYAKSVVTGCISNPTTIAIEDNKIYPQFDFTTKNSLCSQSDGTMSLTWVAPVIVNTIEITNGSLVFDNPESTNMPSGDFNVTLTSPEGCVFSKVVTIGSEFLVYNGISPNGDGKNDQLHIDCIELFPRNVVKIFNRSGMLVYEGSGYDNKMVYFDGFGNKGIYPAGSYLPDGTYYYIVDIGNGEKPRAGFFELLR